MSFLLSDVKTAVQAQGYGADTTAAQTQFVRNVLRRIYGQRRWRFLEQTDTSLSTVVGNGVLSLAGIATLQQVDAVRLTAGTTEFIELEWREEQELRQYDNLDRTNDTPLYWTQRNATILIWPRPVKVYTVSIDYLAYPVLPVADGDTITFPDQFMDVIVAGVVALMAGRQRDYYGRGMASQEYQERIAEMARAFGIAQRQTSRTVQHWSGWEDVQR